eukprot:763470-Hanusia_phi.AAC.1
MAPPRLERPATAGRRMQPKPPPMGNVKHRRPKTARENHVSKSASLNSGKMNGGAKDESFEVQSTPNGKKYIFRLNTLAMVNIDENEVLEVSSDEDVLENESHEGHRGNVISPNDELGFNFSTEEILKLANSMTNVGGVLQFDDSESPDHSFHQRSTTVNSSKPTADPDRGEMETMMLSRAARMDAEPELLAYSDVSYSTSHYHRHETSSDKLNVDIDDSDSYGEGAKNTDISGNPEKEGKNHISDMSISPGYANKNASHTSHVHGRVNRKASTKKQSGIEEYKHGTGIEIEAKHPSIPGKPPTRSTTLTREQPPSLTQSASTIETRQRVKVQPEVADVMLPSDDWSTGSMIPIHKDSQANVGGNAVHMQTKENPEMQKQTIDSVRIDIQEVNDQQKMGEEKPVSNQMEQHITGEGMRSNQNYMQPPLTIINPKHPSRSQKNTSKSNNVDQLAGEPLPREAGLSFEEAGPEETAAQQEGQEQRAPA